MYAALLNNQLVSAKVIANADGSKQTELQRLHYFCPHCQAEVQLVIGSKTAYFRHLTQVGVHINEKEEHSLSKHLLQDALIQANFAAQVEIPLAAGQLRADVLASPRLAFEVQCAPLSTTEFHHRHLLYERIGVKDIWLVGRRHYLHRNLKKSQLIFFRANKLWHDYYLEINPDKRIIRLKYNVMLEPLTNRLHYQTSTFDLNASGLDKLWHFHPFLQKYYPNVGKQKDYLQRQIIEKSDLGMKLAARMYQKKMTIADLPQWVFTTFRRINQPDNATRYLN